MGVPLYVCMYFYVCGQMPMVVFIVIGKEYCFYKLQTKIFPQNSSCTFIPVCR